jgi:hypothetical protein
MTQTAAVQFPLSVEELSTQWLDRVFAMREGAPRVIGSEVERIIWGTATKVIMRVVCEDSSGKRFTRGVCVKGRFDERLKDYYDLGVLFVLEAAFYRDVAPTLPIPLPECYYADEDTENGVVILENLVERQATFGDPCASLTAAQVAQVLDILAVLHATTWHWKPGNFPWLRIGSPSQRVGIKAMAAGGRFKDLSSRPEVAAFMSRPYADEERILSALETLWLRDDASALYALSHGDAHIGQLYFNPDGQAGLLDWQGIALMPWAKDVAYFIGSALSVPDRRHHERDLLASYLQALERSGGPRISPADAWQEYRVQMLQGIVWAVVTEQMQPIEAIRALNERYLTAMSDLGTMAALGL